ncbi:radical SAM protein [Fundidesulfovibrio soli]|uniref:radical SAM protein n=1 Tax=Fundidesulfovibrio soli TaxID=2922716 RepID=UPI001FAEDB4E
MSLTPHHMLHTPGQPALSGVLDLGLRCVHSCRFCYYSFHGGAVEQFAPLRGAPLRSAEDCREILTLFKEQGFVRFDVTGGEPTLHPELTAIIRHGCAELGLAGRVITLGQLLARPGAACGKYLLDDLLDAGLTDFLFSLHAADEDSFKDFTGGSLKRQLRAMRELDRRGVQYGANTVVFSGSAPLLPDIARLAASRGVWAHNFILFNAYHEWSATGRAAGVQAPYRDIAPKLAEAVEILTEAGVAVNIRFAPLCAFPGLERHVVGVLGLPFDPSEWRNRACNIEREPAYCAKAIELPADGVRPEHAVSPLDEALQHGVRATGQRGKRFKLFAGPCASCAARPACDGLDPAYLERYGDAELRPFAEAALSGPLLRARLDYAPAFAVKLAQQADMRAFVRGLAAQVPPLPAR